MREGEPLQVLQLTDLKRMKITELSKMSHTLGIEGSQGLKKQELANPSRYTRPRVFPSTCWDIVPGDVFARRESGDRG